MANVYEQIPEILEEVDEADHPETLCCDEIISLVEPLSSWRRGYWNDARVEG